MRNDPLVMDFAPELEQHPIHPPRDVRNRNRWNAGLAILGTLLVALLTASVVSIEKKFTTTWKTDVEKFLWVVLVQGDQIVMDEVGRFLNQAEGVQGVTFVSAEQSLQHFKDSGDMTDELRGLDVNPFPAAYHVRWESAILESDRLSSTLHDLRMFPGVVDVAYDGRTLSSLRDARLVSYQVRATLAVVILLVSMGVVLVIGRFLFLARLEQFSAKSLLLQMMADGLAWATGVLLASRFLPGMPWWLYTVGLGLGAVRSMHRLAARPRA